MGHQIADPFHYDVILGLGAEGRIGLLLQLLQQAAVFFLRRRLVVTSVEVVEQLVDADVAAADAGQQIFQLLRMEALQHHLVHLGERQVVPVQLLLQQLLAGGNVLVPIQLSEPGRHLGPRPAGAQEARIGVHPVAARVRLLLGDHLHLIAGLQRVGKGHNAAIHLGPDAAVADHAVDVIGEIERGGPRRQVDDVPLGGEYIDPVLEHLTAQIVQQGAAFGEILLPGEELAQPLDLVFEGTGLGGGLSPFLVAPVSRDAEFGILMHLLGADLDLHRLPLLPHHHCVDGLVAVGLGVGDIVVKFAGNMMEMGVDDAERRITILQPLGDHPHRTHVEQLVEFEVLLLHLAPDAVDVFRAAIDFGLDPGLRQRIAQGLHELADVALPIESFLVELLGDLLVGIRVQVTEGEIFELPLELTYAEAVGERRIDVGDLLGHQHPGLLIRQLGFPQAGDPLRQLDDDSAHILHHGEQHAAHVVHLLRGGLATVQGLQRADGLHLQHPFHQLGDLGTEVLVHLLLLDEAGFDEGIENGRFEGGEIHAEHQQYAHHLDATHQQAVGERLVAKRQTVLVDGSQLILVAFTQGKGTDPLLQSEIVFQMNFAHRNHGINP